MRDFDAKVELNRGSGGIFDVFVEGDLVYSKADTGRFPHEGEVTKILKNR